MLSTSKSGESGKAAASQSSFFVQYFPLQNPLNPRELQMHVLPDSGIPIRDYFAARALALLSGYDDDADNFSAMARDAYRLADAMMRAREVKPCESFPCRYPECECEPK